MKRFCHNFARGDNIRGQDRTGNLPKTGTAFADGAKFSLSEYLAMRREASISKSELLPLVVYSFP